MTTDAPRTPDAKRISNDLEILGARIINIRHNVRLLRSELRDLIGELHRLTTEIDLLTPEGDEADFEESH